MRRFRWKALLLVLGTALAVALFLVAQPKAVLELFTGISGPTLVLAFVLHLAIVGTRAWRLKLLSARTLGVASAFFLFTASQAVSSLLPWRLGEMVLPPLARWTMRSKLSQGAFWWLAGRFFDLWSLAVAVAVLALLGLVPLALVFPAFFLLLFLAFAAWASAHRQTWRVVVRWLPTRRLVRGALRMRRLLVDLGHRPAVVAASFALSLLAWALIVSFTAVLCRGMGASLSLGQVLLSVLGATLGAAIPIAGLGNLGPLEAGFASALTLTGVPTAQALSLGFALHFWTLAFQLILGFPAMAGLVLKVKR